MILIKQLIIKKYKIKNYIKDKYKYYGKIIVIY